MNPVAIIGMACIYPGAPNLAAFWNNIVNGVDAISDVPASRWDPVFYDPSSTAVDRFYCKRGGFVDAFADFEPLRYGVMPNAVEAADPDQLLSLRVGIEALADAGYATRDFPRAKTGVIVGRGNYIGAGAVRLQQQVRLVEQTLTFLRDLVPGVSESELDAVRTQIRGKLEHYGPDVAVGLIPNLAASRLANRLDLHGPAYTLDAACASSLIAVEQACTALNSGDADMMLAGGLHFTHDLSFWATFCQLGALSRTQKVKPLSRDADGILAGEGIGMLVLKRLADAERDGDRIYAVLEGIATASDGRASSLLAPSAEGQLITLDRAWRDVPFARDRVGLVEAHGTGTPTGDRTELETLATFFGDGSDANPGERRGVIGSVKSMIGHTMPAAGAAGLIKTALSIYHGVLPPTLHCDNPHEALERTRFRVIPEQETWPMDAENRVACVNAFGFGGINSHAVLRGHISAPDSASQLVHKNAPNPGATAEPETSVSKAPKLVFLSATSRDALLAQLDAGAFRSTPDANTGIGNENWRLAIINPDAKRLALARTVIEKGQPWYGRQQIWFAHDGQLAGTGHIAFVFPGIDSRFAPRAIDLAAHFRKPLPPHCRELDPKQDLLPVSLGVSEFNAFLHECLKQLRIKPDAYAGHSNGEWSAMTASGMLDKRASDEALAQIDFTSVQLPDVAFLVASCDVDTIHAACNGMHEIVVSHDNCPHQVIVCGNREAIAEIATRLAQQQVLCQRLPFSSGFHTPFMAAHIDRYRTFFNINSLHQTEIPVWSATLAAPYPKHETARKQLAVDHLLKPVRFREMLLNMHATGFRTFIQVGTGSLTGFIDDTLKGLPHLAIAANTEARSGLEQLAQLTAALWVEGGDMDFAWLAGGEPVKATQSSMEQAAPANAENTRKISSTKQPGMRLTLGVPLMRLEKPLSRPRCSAAENDELLALASGDPVQRAVHSTLNEIRSAQQEILSVWQRRKQSAVTHLPAQNEPAPFDITVVRRLDMNDNIACVRDHARFPQGNDSQGNPWPVAADHNHIVPLTMEVAMICREVEARLPGHVVVELRDVQAYNWLTVDEPVDVPIHLRMTQFPEIDVDIVGHLRARVFVARNYPLSPNENELRKILPPLSNARPAAIDANALYADDWMFHGPQYRGVIELGPVGDNGIHGKLRVPSGDGGLLDNMGQLAGYRVMEEPEDCLAMPIGVDRIRLFRAPPATGEEFSCSIRLRQLDKENSITDQVLQDENGNAVAIMEGWQARRFAMDHAFWIRSKSWQENLVSDEIATGVVLFHDTFDTAVVRDYIAKRVLNQPETAEYATKSPRARRQWLNGRVAVKDAVRALLWREQGHATLYPKCLRITNADNGQPVINPHIRDVLNGNMHVSISHKGAWAIAAAGRHPVGVDVEAITPRDESFLLTAFTAHEIALLPSAGTESDENERNETIARFWVAKEVIAKQDGTGLRGRPADFLVTQIHNERVCVNGRWVETRRHDNHIIGWRTHT